VLNIKTYSQLGEDLIVAGIANMMRLKSFSYVDIGANSPINLSNTYLFYEAGYKGVLVEPNPSCCAELKSVRPRDICLNNGIAWDKETCADFFVMTANTLSTFSQAEVAHCLTPEAIKGWGIQKAEKVIKIQLISINEVFEKYVGGTPDFLSIDTEGMDLPILKTICFDRFRPRIICIETNGGHVGSSHADIVVFMKDKGYRAFADTGLNVIFI